MMVKSHAFSSFLLLFAAAPAVTNALPAGFVDQGLYSFSGPTDISHIPGSADDGGNTQRWLVTGKNGLLTVLAVTEGEGGVAGREDPTVEAVTAANFESVVCDNGERGLQSAVAHPEFPAKP
jgi:hypothetical protein